MSRFSGKTGKGAMRKYREDARTRAEVRQEEDRPVERTKAYRYGPVTQPDGIRTERSVIQYRETFRAEHGVYPEETERYREVNDR